MKRSLRVLLTATLFAAASPAFAQLSIPEIPYDSAPDLLKMPDDIYLGEAVGVATNSKGHIYVYTRTGSVNVSTGTNRAFVRNAARLFEFDASGDFVREIGQGLYGFVFAHTVRVDPMDNVWVVDEGSNMVIKFDPQGRVLMTMGRKPEAIRIPNEEPETGAPAPDAPVGEGVPGDNFNRPTDVAWDAAGNIFVSDGYGNSRVAKFDKNGKFLKSWGSKGTAPGQFNTLHTIATDAAGNVYVGDRGNRRIQVFDNDGNFKTQFLNVGRSLGALHHSRPPSVPLQLELEPDRQHGRRRDLQDGARRHDRGQVRKGGKAFEGVRLDARDRLPERERALRGRDHELEGAEAYALSRARSGLPVNHVDSSRRTSWSRISSARSMVSRWTRNETTASLRVKRPSRTVELRNTRPSR